MNELQLLLMETRERSTLRIGSFARRLGRQSKNTCLLTSPFLPRKEHRRTPKTPCDISSRCTPLYSDCRPLAGSLGRCTKMAALVRIDSAVPRALVANSKLQGLISFSSKNDVACVTNDGHTGLISAHQGCSEEVAESTALLKTYRFTRKGA